MSSAPEDCWSTACNLSDNHSTSNIDRMSDSKQLQTVRLQMWLEDDRYGFVAFRNVPGMATDAHRGDPNTSTVGAGEEVQECEGPLGGQ